jgi:DNA-binding transcriptional LysR family regulator
MLRHDLQTLRIFLLACELRSMSKAADHLNLAVSAASRRVSLLEHEAKVPLIMRRPHGIEPTAAGITMMRYARDVLRLGEKLQGNLDEHRSGIRGYVRVSASSSVLVQRLARDLSRFVNENPEIKLDLEERPSIATIDAVLHKQADIGIIVRGVRAEGVTLIDYAGDRLAVAAPKAHPLARRQQLSFAEILDEDMVALESGTAVHGLLSARAAELGRSLKVRVQVRSFEVMCLMIGQNLGIGILPERAIEPLAAAMGVKLVNLAESWARREYSICMLSLDDLELPTRRLVEFLTRRDGKKIDVPVAAASAKDHVGAKRKRPR